MADFQKALNSRIFGVFRSGFFPQNNFNALVESFLACFWHFYFLNETDHLAKPIAHAKAIAFARWPIFKMVLILEYLVFFGAVFCAEEL